MRSIRQITRRLRSINVGNADMNSDGKINITDVTMALNIALNN